MRKVIATIIVAIFIFILCISYAFAETEGYTCDKFSDSSKYHGVVEYINGIYTVSYDNGVAESQYVLYVIRNNGVYDDYSIDSNSILYIDQKKSDASGQIHFEFSLVKPPDCTVILAGASQKLILGVLIRQGDPEDVNSDGCVDLLDVVTAAKKYGLEDDSCDMNSDGIVNLFDLVVIARKVM